MRTSDFDYELPPELIAQTPLAQRDQSRLLVARRSDRSIEHRRFHELPDLLDPGDLLVLNDSRVIPARLFGYRAGLGVSGRVELLLLRRLDNAGLWECLAKPARRLRAGASIMLEPARGTALRQGQLACRAVVEEERPDGIRLIRFDDETEALRRGTVPIPPYIKNELDDPERYQTVYATEPGSAAAPTAGLHFTPEVLQRAAARGIRTATVTLHVGLDTFRPVDEDEPMQHHIHTEYVDVPRSTADAVRETRAAGRRVIAVGTTSVRSLESAAQHGEIAPFLGPTSLYILPGYQYRAIDGMTTNFHLPRSTLLFLVGAWLGVDFLKQVYAEAIAQHYRFYSFGDTSLLL
jgi:S-adenosylmethionine:tRNA ribosyltransferase-isomerase